MAPYLLILVAFIFLGAFIGVVKNNELSGDAKLGSGFILSCAIAGCLISAITLFNKHETQMHELETLRIKLQVEAANKK